MTDSLSLNSFKQATENFSFRFFQSTMGRFFIVVFAMALLGLGLGLDSFVPFHECGSFIASCKACPEDCTLTFHLLLLAGSDEF